LIKKISDKDKKDWLQFIDSKEKVENKDNINQKLSKNFKEKSIDLHGYSLEDANKLIYKFILLCYEKNVSEIKIITGKGTRSKNKENPYQSENLGILKYSVPEYINSETALIKVIKSISKKDIEDISKGSFKIILKKNDKNY
jgi:DNA-nicking Smr family endonuclease|tara:strand:+ start:218 stop:643 length:426 start_codon:yes stop_codon:yes gene_type:complete